MSYNILDRRVQKTRKLLQDAMVELISENGYEAIKIQDILDKANVGRSTFYAHFQDKRELLDSCFDELSKLLEQNALSLSEEWKVSEDNNHDVDFIPKFFRLVERNYLLFKALLGKQGIPSLVNDFLFSHLHDPFKKRMFLNGQTAIPSEIVYQYFNSALVGTLKWWVSEDMPCTAEEIGKYFLQLTIPSFKNLIASDVNLQ